MKSNLVSLVIINYNNKDYLNRCLKSIFNQSYKMLEIIFIDNESKDGSFEYMEKEYSNESILLIKNTINNGYAGAANQGINMANGEFIMIINPDIVMEEDFVENLVQYMLKDLTCGAITGKLLKYDFVKDKKLNYIDSAGIEMYKSTRCIDRGQNELDQGQYDKTEEVFGVCGAAPMYRKSALEKIKYKNEYFDEDFFAYKEDVDLSWRLNLVGEKNIYYPKAIAYHGRALGRSEKGVLNFIKHRKKQSEFLRGISYRNHLMMLEKNKFSDFIIENRRKIQRRQIMLLIYSVFFERFIFKFRKEAKLNIRLMNEKKEFFKKENKIKSIKHLVK